MVQPTIAIRLATFFILALPRRLWWLPPIVMFVVGLALVRIEGSRITPGRLALGVAIAALGAVVVHYI
jgi:hypothetical protein